jgi:YrbI family 3-deoxy-D-manno-octulosonate 8-phosphate phosphatase
MGFNLLTKAGVKTGIITTEYTKIVERRAAKLKIDYVYQGRGFGSKLEAAKEICLKEGISLKETAYIGDDINCIELLQEAGIAACPANAVEQVKNIKGIIHLEKKGGEGAVREFIEMLFKQGLIEGNK